MQTAPFDWPSLLLDSVAGIALFLYGVSLLATGLRKLEGERFRRWIARSTEHRLSGLAAGTAATVLLDSSSVVIILLVAMVDATLVPFGHALPMVLGANIGTTFSSQVFAWDVDRWSPLIVAAGVLGQALAKGDKAQAWTRALLGLGLVLLGLHLLGEAAEPLEKRPEIVEWLKRLESPLLGMAAGALVTVAIQSSSAMMGIVITLAGGGIITLPAGLALMLGAEIGTCTDTLAATIGRSRAAVRVGLFHLFYNIVAVALGLLLLGPLAALASASAGETGQRIANAHMIFNVAGAVLLLPFTQTVARLLERLLPDRGDEPGKAKLADAT